MAKTHVRAKKTFLLFESGDTSSSGLKEGADLEKNRMSRAITQNWMKIISTMLMYVKIWWTRGDTAEFAMCPPSNCQAGKRLMKVMMKPSVYAKYRTENSGPSTTLFGEAAAPPLTSPRTKVVNMSTGTVGGGLLRGRGTMIALAAATKATITVIANPATGPERPKSNSASRFTGGSADLITAPKVGRNDGIPGMKYGHDDSILCFHDATLCPNSCTPIIPTREAV